MYGKESLAQTGGYNSVAPETRQPEVQAAIDRVNGNFEYVVARLLVLTGRIQPVLAGPSIGRESSPTPGYSSDLASRLGSHADKLADLGFAVDDLLNRLEI